MSEEPDRQYFYDELHKLRVRLDQDMELLSRIRQCLHRAAVRLSGHEHLTRDFREITNLMDEIDILLLRK